MKASLFQRAITALSHLIGGWIVRKSHRWLNTVYCQPENRNQTFLLRFLFQLHNLGNLLICGVDFRITRWTGLEKESGVPFTVIHFGDRKAAGYHSIAYLETILFEPGSAKREDAGTCLLWNLVERVQDLSRSADLLVIERNHLLTWKPNSGDWVQTPAWVRHTFDLDPHESWESVQHRMRSQKRNIRQMNRAGFTPRITRSDADFDLFYEHMHVPLIQRRHGDYGTVSKKENLRRFLKQGMIMFVENEAGEPVAGDLLQAFDGVMFNIVGGVLDGDSEWYEHGALSALYYYEIQWVHQNGYRQLDAGGTRPFLADGVYQHKQRWGMTTDWNWWEPSDWLLWAPEGSKAGYRWLRNHPVDPKLACTSLCRSEEVHLPKPETST